MTDYDVDLELEERKISLYEDELSLFTAEYLRNKELQKKIYKEYGLSISYGEYEEAFELDDKDGVITFERSLDKIIERMFNLIRQIDYKKQLEETDLPF